jgi:hypothetical protein
MQHIPEQDEVSMDDDDDDDWTSAEVDSTCIPYNTYVQIQAGSTRMANTVTCNIVMRPQSTDDVITSTRSIGDNLEIPSSVSSKGVTVTASSPKHKRNIIKYEAQANEPNNVSSTHDCSLFMIKLYLRHR